MIDFSRNHFELFGLPARFRCDTAALDRAYRTLQTEVHPDRFAAAADSDRRVALQSSARVNEAYRALKDPVSRAQYLLALHGVDAMAETDTALSIDFLERQLERREAAADAVAARDARTLDAIATSVRAEIVDREAILADLIDGAGAYESARAAVRELRFLTKLAADLDDSLGELEDVA